ncbi:MAG: two-component sensor histidine kinase [Solirubrobacterales bacterium]|nr:two-component sensor histidine kinase [Solirubrobacterales bacterium]
MRSLASRAVDTPWEKTPAGRRTRVCGAAVDTSGVLAASLSAFPLRFGCRLACTAVILTALLVLVGGWTLDVATLRKVVPGTVAMKPLTALGLIANAGGLLLHLSPGAPWRLRTARGCASLSVILGVAVLSEYVLGWRLGIDELLFRDDAGHALGIAYPGRFAPTTAVCFLLLGVAVGGLDAREWHGWRLAEVVAVPVASLGALTTIGYLYAIPLFYGPASAAKMALTTGICFLTLAAAVVLTRPRGRLVDLATTSDPGGSWCGGCFRSRCSCQCSSAGGASGHRRRPLRAARRHLVAERDDDPGAHRDDYAGNPNHVSIRRTYGRPHRSRPTKHASD